MTNLAHTKAIAKFILHRIAQIDCPTPRTHREIRVVFEFRYKFGSVYMYLD